MPNNNVVFNYHESEARTLAVRPDTQFTYKIKPPPDTQFTYTFENFFHPFVGELIAKLNRESLAGMMDASWHEELSENHFFTDFYKRISNAIVSVVQVSSSPKQFDVAPGGSYSNYNWELFFHIPLTIAVHLSKNQRFAEAQRWFHYIFDPTSSDPTMEPVQRFWKFIAFRKKDDSKQIDELLRLLSDPDADPVKRKDILNGYQAILDKPFQPHVVARTRPLAYQYSVVMKYLDNLIAWGDQLFQQDTVESINEATQRYVLAANLLGPRPQRIPPSGGVRPKTFAQLKGKVDPMGNALVELEGQFPFNLSSLSSRKVDPSSSSLFGIGRALYFCIPRNDKLLSYWDTVADRLFKIRHCMNMEGIVRPLALFDPPIDPGMLVKAAAAGMDIGSIVNGLNKPIGPLRSLAMIQKALELAGELRGLGGALLAALEKGDSEHLAIVRQGHEIQVQEMAQNVRFLQWKQAQEATTSLLTTRATALERLRYYQRLLGLPPDVNAPDTLQLDHSAKPEDAPKLNEENFDDAYASLVAQFDKALAIQKLPELKQAGDASPGQKSGASSAGRLYLNQNEDADLNEHSRNARDYRLASTVSDGIAQGLALIPNPSVNVHFWGLGGTAGLPGGTIISAAGRIASSALSTNASDQESRGASASKTGSHERRADDWLLQYNLAAHELMQIGRQILTSLISEQIAQHEYRNIFQQIANAQAVDQVLREKFTNEELYGWMQGEISRLYYEYYRFAFDTARKAEKTMKQELMRPELDAQDFIKFNYWDGGRKGLLSGEALYLDLKRLEMAYHDNNKRELELTKHVSLRQLDPIALLKLKVEGTCQVTVPEWLYDLDCPGHYMRRIKNVGISIPSVVGPYTSINCTLSLLKSSVRKSSIAGDEYARQGSEDDRFINYSGAVQSIVTSSGQNDSGLFETNLRDERFLPFEGAGAESTWKLDLPTEYPAFDYATISDVILHIRYTARQGLVVKTVTDALGDLFEQVDGGSFALLFSLKHEFSTEWAAFLSGNGDFKATIRRDYFPYFTRRKDIRMTRWELRAVDSDGQLVSEPLGNEDLWGPSTDDLKDKAAFSLTAAESPILKRAPDAEVFLIIHYSLE